jgi:excisionase family DNA binding protein
MRMHRPAEDRLVNSDELAEALTCTRETVYALIRQGMPAMRLGTGKRAEWRFSLAAVRRWLAECAGANGVAAPCRNEAGLGDVFRSRTICR